MTTYLNKLYQYQDLKYRDFSKQLLPGVNNIIGIRLPILRKLSKTLTLDELSDNTFEEIMLQGMIIGNFNTFEDFKITCLTFLPKIDNWSVCDSFVNSLTISKKYPEEVFEFLNNIFESKHSFTRRFVLVMILKYYLKPEYINSVCNILKKIPKEEYYVKMAYSWCLAEMYLNFPDIVLSIMNNPVYKIDRFILQKTISKVRDSKKISSASKQVIKNKFKN